MLSAKRDGSDKVIPQIVGLNPSLHTCHPSLNMNASRGRPRTPRDIERGTKLVDAEYSDNPVNPDVDKTIEHPAGCCHGNACRCVLYCVDLFLCFTVFSVLNVAYWRGAWGLLDLYLLPGEMDYEVLAIRGSAISYAIGASSRIIRVALEPTFRKLHNALRYGWAQHVAKIIFNFFDGCFMIAQWRGLYNILDFYVGYDLLPNIISLSIATVILVGSRSFSSILGLPMCLIRDNRKDFYVCWPRYRTTVRQSIAPE